MKATLNESAWMDIETAPKDGTWVLVYGGGTSDEAEQRKIAVAQYSNYLNSGTCVWHWQFAWYDGGYYGVFEEPTHWMPLPAPPKQS